MEFWRIEHLTRMRFLKLSLYAALFNFSLILCSICSIVYFDHTARAKIISLFDLCTTCEKATEIAAKDFENGKYILVLSGSSTKSDLRNQILQDKYNITVLNPGCVFGSEEVYCYSNTQAGKLGEKYGFNFYDDTMKEVGERMDRIIKEQLHFNDLPQPKIIHSPKTD